jgi:hypothetical protein
LSLRPPYVDVELRPSRSVEDLRQWIAHDIKDYKEGAIDKMLEELLSRCTDNSKPLPDKSELLKHSLNAVVPTCNGDIMKKHMGTL